MNWFPEQPEVEGSVSPIAMYSTPGLAIFAALTGNTRGGLETNGRLFAVAGTTLYEVFSNGSSSVLGTVANDGNRVSMCASEIELCVASGGTVYIFNLGTSVFTAIPGATFSGPIVQVAFCDSFFLALVKNTQKFYISAVLNGLSWPGGQVIQVSVFPDNIVSMIVDHRQVIFFGLSQSVAYEATGSAQIFDLIGSSLMEQGAIATFGSVKLDNTVFWIGGDDRGSGIAWRLNGYTPQRVSNHAVELAWQGYSTIADAVSYSWQYLGHLFWQIYFPTANKTWVFDVTTNMWHERGFWNGASFDAHRSWWHVEVFGKHLVGDWASGNIYETSLSILDDFGNAIRRVRRAPQLINDRQFFFVHKLELYLESGLGPQPPLTDGAGNPRDPMIDLRWSKDGGHSWSNSYSVGAGQAGQYNTRVQWRRLGNARGWIAEISVSDPIAWKIVDDFIVTSPGNGA